MKENILMIGFIGVTTFCGRVLGLLWVLAVVLPSTSANSAQAIILPMSPLYTKTKA